MEGLPYWEFRPQNFQGIGYCRKPFIVLDYIIKRLGDLLGRIAPSVLYKPVNQDRAQIDPVKLGYP